MRKSIKVLSGLMATLIIGTTASAASIELYALDGRTLVVEEEQVELYTAPGMGWFKEKPVTMYALDGRTLVVPADKVEAHKAVGWYLEEDLPKENDAEAAPEKEPVPEDVVVEKPADEKVAMEYTDGSVVRVPANHVETYKLLGWVVAGDIVENGNDSPSAGKEDKLVTVFNNEGLSKQIKESELKSYNAKGYWATYEEAVYKYAMYGDGDKVTGAKEFLENKMYDASYGMVRDALDKIENSGTNYVNELYTMRSKIMKTWNEAAKSPLGFVNDWFDVLDGKIHAFFEYRNVTDKRISSLKIKFDICDKDGNILDAGHSTYSVDNLKMAPCQKKKLAWAVENGDKAVSFKNIKVLEVVFDDGTKWSASN